MGETGGRQLGNPRARNGPKIHRKKEKMFVQLPTKYRELDGTQIFLICSQIFAIGAYLK
jgi:hypothetical protein